MPELIVPLIRATFLPLEVTESITLTKHFDLVEIDATSGNIIITLPLITHVFRNKPSILFKRIDSTSNTVTFIGTSSNYEDENFQIGNDPQLESIKIYASKANIWRRDGYGLPEQQTYYRNLSTGLIRSGSIGDDPLTLLTDNGDGTIDINFGGEFRVVDRVNDDNTLPILTNQFFKIRSRRFTWAAESNITSGSDGQFWIVVDETSNINITLSTNGLLIVPVFSDNAINLNNNVQLGAMVKTAGAISLIEPAPVVDNNLPNFIRHIARSGIGVVNSADNPVIISPVSGTINLAINDGIVFTGSPGFWVESGGLATNFFRTAATSPVVIALVDRAGTGNVINISTSANVTEYESALGVFSAIGANKAANRFYQAATTLITELLGQEIFTGGSALTAAAASDESIDIPALTGLLPKVVKMSVFDSSTDLSLETQAIFTILKQDR